MEISSTATIPMEYGRCVLSESENSQQQLIEQPDFLVCHRYCNAFHA